MQRAAKTAGFLEPLEYNDVEFSLKHGEDGSQVLNLHNAHRDYCSAPRLQRERVLQRYASVLTVPPTPTSFDEARSHLMPIVRSRSWVEYQRLKHRQSSSETPFVDMSLPFSDDAVLMIAYDTPQTIRTIGADDLKRWDTGLEELVNIATENLRSRTTDAFVQVAPGVFRGMWGDAYDASRALLPDLLHRGPVGTSPAFMIPTRDTILVCASEAVQPLLRMFAVARECTQKQGRSVSASLYRIVEGRPQSYEPADAMAAAALQDLRRLELADAYQMQKEELELLHEQKQEDIFVASYSLFEEGGTERLFSLCTWTKGVDTMLPETDRIAFVQIEGDRAESAKVVEWAQAYAAVSHLMEVEPGYPVRYRVNEWPDKHLLDAMPTLP